MNNLKSEIAVARFREGFCCSQAVFSVFAPELGLDEADALRLAEGFGAGMSLPGICGAVSGAVLTVGLRYGRTVAGDEESKQKTRALIKTFYRRFSESHGALDCKTLTGCDVTNTEESDKAEAAGVFDDVCPKLIASAVAILNDIMD